MRRRGAARPSGDRVCPRISAANPKGQTCPHFPAGRSPYHEFQCPDQARRYDGRKGPCHENWAVIAAAFASACPNRLLPFP
jgi:hypothetical protein